MLAQDFPHITHISQVLEAIKDSPNLFSVQHDSKRGLIFVKYKSIISTDQAFPELLVPSSASSTTVTAASTTAATTESENLRRKIRRECRGLVFHQATGQLLVRRFHKFFNLNERRECDIERIDFRNRPFMCLEKMDGSLMSPVRLLPSSSAAPPQFNRASSMSSKSSSSSSSSVKTTIELCTMLGFSQQAQMANDYIKYLKAKYHKSSSSTLKGGAPFQYEEFCHYCIDNGMTPSFEFISAENRIVIKYDKTELILLCVRHNETGQYVSYDQLAQWAEQYQIPLVKKWNLESMMTMRDGTSSPVSDKTVEKTDDKIAENKDNSDNVDTAVSNTIDGRQLMEFVRKMNGVEGCVIVFTDNYDMYKCKTTSYAIAHSVHPERVKERQIWRAVLSNIVDDLIAIVDFDYRIRDVLQQFRTEFESCLQHKLDSIVDTMKKLLSDNEGTLLLNNVVSVEDDAERCMSQSVATKLLNTLKAKNTSDQKSISEYDVHVMTRVLTNYETSLLISSIHRHELPVNDKHNDSGMELSDYVLTELQQYLLTKYIEGAMRIFEEHRTELYKWLGFSFDAIHPFNFETSTGTLYIHKHTFKAMNEEESRKFADLHYSMMSPKRSSGDSSKKSQKLSVTGSSNSSGSGSGSSRKKQQQSKNFDDDIFDTVYLPSSVKAVTGVGKALSYTKAKSQKKKGGSNKKKGK